MFLNIFVTDKCLPVHSQGQIPHGDGQQQAYSHGPSASIFTEVNQKLRETGIPSWNIGPYVVEPIVSVAAVIAVLFFGLPGLLIVAALFFVSVWSQGQGTGGGAQGAQAGSRNTGGGGGGWRPGGRGGNVLGRR